MIRREKASRYLHVYYHRDWKKPWEARIRTLNIALGCYETEEEAHQAVEKFLDTIGVPITI